MNPLIIIGGNEDAKRKGAILRIIATIILFPIWVYTLDKCGRNESDIIEEKYNVEINIYRDSTLTANKLIRLDTMIIEYKHYLNDSYSVVYEYVPKNKNVGSKKLDALERRLNKNLKKRIKEEK